MDAQRAAKFCIQAKRSAPETLQIIQNTWWLCSQSFQHLSTVHLFL